MSYSALLEVNRHARSGEYDVVIVDCAPTAETLRLLSLPEVLSWYFEKVLPTERRLMRAARPILSRLTDLPFQKMKCSLPPSQCSSRSTMSKN